MLDAGRIRSEIAMQLELTEEQRLIVQGVR